MKRRVYRAHRGVQRNQISDAAINSLIEESYYLAKRAGDLRTRNEAVLLASDVRRDIHTSAKEWLLQEGLATPEEIAWVKNHPVPAEDAIVAVLAKKGTLHYAVAAGKKRR